MRISWLLFLPLFFATADDAEEEALREVINSGRGSRDSVGVRDQWDSIHKEKYDSRRLPNSKALRLLRRYGLECKGCNASEATEKINDFVRKMRREEDIKKWLQRASLVVLSCIVFLVYKLSAGTTGRVSDFDRMAREIEDRQRRFQENDREVKRAPSWREVEEKEVWTAQQEKRFEKALAALGGIAGRERYAFIADRVRDKTKLECLMHHKLLQARAKDQ